ncbi:Metacaspase-7 [Mycena venus]|uniref:Metacaspase-7 n=1 Tax=Mycena venus TaxID=2733690 RepID=A0A8H6YCJ3_9AGAR|nr:Metacaspase-7 [Mycena venus]
MPKVTSSVDGTGTVFALIIGNNNYRTTDVYHILQGAVNDARAFEKYVTDSRAQRGLQVPPSNIVVLENATRENIISTFKSHFLDNPNIPDHGKATMILFYAGHGTRITATGNRISTDSKVEAIAPVDERTTDSDGKYVHAIPDYILGWLLWELSEKKGPNITVILDSCFSGGMGRNVGTARNGNSESPPVPLELDDYLWKGKSQDATMMAYHAWSPSATSHVLIAACRHNEKAYEFGYGDQDSIHGRFTKELITWLRRVPLEDTTYTELLNHLPVWPEQTPQCGGSRNDRLVFNGNYPAPATKQWALNLTVQTSDDPEASIPQSFRVDIGTVEGVSPGTVFAIHAGDNSLCTLVADSVQVGHSILVAKNKQPVTIPEGARAVVWDWKNDAMVLHIHVPLAFPYMSDLFPTTNITYQPQSRKYVQAQDLVTADIAVRTEGQEIVIDHLTGTMLECQHEARFSVDGNTGHLPAVVDGIAHFNYFLERHNASEWLEGVSFEMHRLVGKYPGRKPDRSVGIEGNMITNGAADAKYGFTLRNSSPVNLFPYLYFFDPEMYTIKCWYSPVSVRDAAPLKSSGVVTVGMGSKRAFVFPATLPPDVPTSFSFLKLFVSTVPLDAKWIEQETSPFDPKFRFPIHQEPLKFSHTWCALKVIMTLTA